MLSHEIDYKIFGDDIQFVEIELDPRETVIAEAGTMVYMEQGITFEAKMGDGSEANQSIMGKLFQAGSRILTGESLFITHFTNNGNGKSRVAFAAPYPGTIIPVDLRQVRNSLIVQKDGFLCAAFGTKLSITLNKRIGSGLLGGEGFILQKVEGDGKAFIHAGGTVIEKQLNNETLRIDTGCVVAFEPSLDFDIEASGSLKSMKINLKYRIILKNSVRSVRKTLLIGKIRQSMQKKQVRQLLQHLEVQPLVILHWYLLFSLNIQRE